MKLLSIIEQNDNCETYNFFVYFNTHARQVQKVDTLAYKIYSQMFEHVIKN